MSSTEAQIQSIHEELVKFKDSFQVLAKVVSLGTKPFVTTRGVENF